LASWEFALRHPAQKSDLRSTVSASTLRKIGPAGYGCSVWRLPGEQSLAQLILCGTVAGLAAWHQGHQRTETSKSVGDKAGLICVLREG